MTRGYTPSAAHSNFSLNKKTCLEIM